MLLSASLTTLLALGTVVQAQSGGYASTCYSVNVLVNPLGYAKGYWLMAQCGNGHGGWNDGAALALGTCLGNINGQIKFLPK